MISISKLRAFAAVAEHGSFTSAAKSLGVSTPALSAQVSELERTLGLSLIHRTTRRVDLTGEGTRLFERAKRVLFDLDSIAADLSSEGRLERGRIAVSCVPTLAASLFPDIMARFASLHPQVVIHLIDETTDDLRDRVMRSEADFGIGPDPGPELLFERLASDRFVLACRKEDALSQRKFIGPAELAKLPLIALGRGSNVRTVLDHYFESQGLVLKPRFEVNHHYTLGALVAAGLGYGPLPELALKLTGEPLLKGVPIRRPTCERAIGIVTRPGNRLSPAATALLDVVRENFRAVVQAGSVAS